MSPEGKEVKSGLKWSGPVLSAAVLGTARPVSTRVLTRQVEFAVSSGSWLVLLYTASHLAVALLVFKTILPKV